MTEITRLLEAARSGSESDRAALYNAVYDTLQRLARARLSRESTLTDMDTGSLVNEAYLRLAQQENVPGADRRGFFAYAAKVMRAVIVDYVRERNAVKRGSGESPITLATTRMGDAGLGTLDIDSLEEAMKDLEKIDPRGHRVVELRFYGGLSKPEIAEVLEVSTATVGRDWERARAFLYHTLHG